MDSFITLFAEALDREELINPIDDFRDYDEWDSLAVLSIIAMIKKHYDITIPRKEFEQLQTISDLFGYIENRK